MASWASRCKRVCPRVAAAPTGWPQSVMPASVAPAGYCPCERRRPPLHAGPGRDLAVGGRPCMGAGRGWSPSSSLPLLQKCSKNA
ncbi:hypothetical protein BHM03_00005221 [Ensete ventricosum]|nr:hypothetical protein BHM03_00005221 [Ensete ventricosum]